MTRRYGWIPDPPDQRDWKRHLTWSREQEEALPKTVDPRAKQPPIRNQGALGSCTGHGMTGSLECGNLRNGEPLVRLSPLMAYYNARVLQGTVEYDSGASIRSVIKAAARWGCCSEDLWPYQPKKFTEKPTWDCYKEALTSKALLYERVAETSYAFKKVLAEGLDIVLGFSVYESFESATVRTTGVMPLPKTSERVLGGHCVRIIGYTDEALTDIPANHFIVANSWGTGWGVKGYFAMPYDLLLRSGVISAPWTIRRVA